MRCTECKESNLDKFQVIKEETKLHINSYNGEQWESTLITIKCLECGHEFNEEI